MAESKIRCEFFDRGCEKFIESGDLERHVRECGFAPAVCSNEGCRLEVNKRDLLHHETVTCTQRKEKEIQESAGMHREPMVVIAGGWNGGDDVNSVEMFSLSNGTSTLLQPMSVGRSGASSVIYNDHIFVIGGSFTNSIEKLSIHAVHVDQSIPWENVPVVLPGGLMGHRSVVYNERLIVIGGYDGHSGEYSNRITEVSLVPPHIRRPLGRMRQRRCYHGVALFGDKIVILGGREAGGAASALNTVLMYDITRNVCRELRPLPYAVCDMATAKMGDDSVMIIGGVVSNYETLNSVLKYNVNTEEFHMLPPMNSNRGGSVAAVVRDTVIVIGGQDGNNNNIHTVESLTSFRGTWEVLGAEIQEVRTWATAVAC